MKPSKKVRERLEYLRQELRAERISWGELAELQSLAPFIGKDDVELLEAERSIPKDWPVKPILVGRDAARLLGNRMCICGACDLGWDDDKVTSMTPVPSARCPFEAFHIYREDDDETADDLLTALSNLVHAFGGDVPAWIRPEYDAAVKAIRKAKGK